MVNERHEVVTMAAVGIKELKAHLSTYVSMARDGERIEVTDRGKTVAVLGPDDREREILMDLVGKGLARWSERKPTLSFSTGRVKGEPVSETIVRMRG